MSEHDLNERRESDDPRCRRMTNVADEYGEHLRLEMDDFPTDPGQATVFQHTELLERLEQIERRVLEIEVPEPRRGRADSGANRVIIAKLDLILKMLIKQARDEASASSRPSGG